MVFAKEAIGQPTAKKRKEIHADDKAMENFFGHALTFGDRQIGQDHAADQKLHQNVAHPVEAEAFAGFVADDVGDLRGQLGQISGILSLSDFGHD